MNPGISEAIGALDDPKNDRLSYKTCSTESFLHVK